MGNAVDCVSDTLKLMPAGETHWNRFAADETHGLRIDVDGGRFREAPAIQRLLHQRTHVRGERVGHIVQSLLVEIDAQDDAASLAVEGLLLECSALSAGISPVRGRSRPPTPYRSRRTRAVAHQ